PTQQVISFDLIFSVFFRLFFLFFFFFQAEDGIRDFHVTGVQTCALPISSPWTGKREWPDSTTSPSSSSSGASAGSMTICERGIITSPTLRSETAIAPSIMLRVSVSIRPSACASRSSSTRSSRLEGSPDSAELSRSNQLRRFSWGRSVAPLGAGGWLLSSSDIRRLVSWGAPMGIGCESNADRKSVVEGEWLGGSERC